MPCLSSASFLKIRSMNHVARSVILALAFLALLPLPAGADEFRPCAEEKRVERLWMLYGTSRDLSDRDRFCLADTVIFYLQRDFVDDVCIQLSN